MIADAGSSTVLDIRLAGGEWAAIAAVAGVAVVALGTGALFARRVHLADPGSERMIEIATAIQDGAHAYLTRQFRTIVRVVVVLAGLVFITTTDPLSDNLSVATGRTAAFVAGATTSGLIGFLGMTFAVRGNVRAAAAARNDLGSALRVAFRTGAITGMTTIGFGLLGTAVVFALYQQRAAQVLIGFGFGASLLALFMRVGGGIFTKAADVGADLVGKLEQGIPEDDPRNAATIADNVGDNVGDCAGMAADLYESYTVTLVASMILGDSAARALGLPPVVGVVLPLLIQAVGAGASIIGILAVRARPGETTALRPIGTGFVVSAAVVAAGTAVVVGTYGRAEWRLLAAVLTGLGLAIVLSAITDRFTSIHQTPVQEIADATETGAATTVLAGFAVGLESTVWAILAVAGAISLALVFAGGDLIVALYLVSLTGMGMLATTGVTVSMDTFGPVVDNAGGISEMSGEFEGEPARTMQELDAAGNTTKAITKAFAIGSAVLAAVSLFASFVETTGAERGLGQGHDVFDQVPINIAEPRTFVGLLLGGSIAFLFSALAIRAVRRAASLIVTEVRRQFREHPGILDGSERPEYGRVVDICTAASLRELVTPALLAVLSPVAVGFAVGDAALGAFLGAAILTGQLMAVMLANAGGAWDNAKKYVEEGHHGGKGSAQHRAAVVGDTIGDPFKDTAGPGLNPLIKVINLVSLLVLPLIIRLEDDTAARWSIALVAVAVIVVAIALSKRREGLDERSNRA